MREILKSVFDKEKIEYKQYCKDDEEYVEMINQHIKDRLMRFGIIQYKQSDLYKFCKEKFPAILNELENSDQQRRK